MDADILSGLAQSVLPSSLLATGVGVFLGLIVGMIPGMTISTGIIILLPLTFVLDPNVSIALLLGLYVAGMTGGSFSAILLNIPGTPSASATAIDGFKLSSKGESGRALGIAISASFFGGIISFACLYLIAPALADVALQFQTPDLFSLVFFGLTIICSFSSRSLVKGLLSAAIGLMIVTIGQDPVMGTSRYTFDNPDMLSGIQFLTAMIGLFAIPQLVTNLIEAKSESSSSLVQKAFGSVLPKLKDLFRIRIPTLIGSFAGTFLGILPGAGGPIAAFISYDYSRKVSRKPDEYGKGSIEGIAAPESANNAVAGGALIPMMTLGIPGDPVTAILIGALLIHGLAPGPLLFIENADFAYAIIFSYFWANIFNLVIALTMIRFLTKLLAIPKTILMPAIAILCVIGAYSLRNSFFDIYVMFGFGVIGLAMRWLDMPVVPMLLALVLGPQLEENLRVALTGSRGDISVFFTSGFSLFFLVLSALSLAWSFYSAYRESAKNKHSPDGSTS